MAESAELRIGEIVRLRDPMNPTDGEFVNGQVVGKGWKCAYVNVTGPDGVFYRELNVRYDRLEKLMEDKR